MESDLTSLLNVEGHIVVAREGDTVGDANVLVGNDAVKLRILAYVSTVEEHAVLYNSALLYLNVSEDYRVNNSTLNLN